MVPLSDDRLDLSLQKRLRRFGERRKKINDVQWFGRHVAKTVGFPSHGQALTAESTRTVTQSRARPSNGQG